MAPSAQSTEPKEEEEEVIALPKAEKDSDVLLRASVQRLVKGVVHYGIVVDIEQEKKSGERLYLVKYTDGDAEHLTADQMRSLVVENGSGRCKAVHSGDEAPRAADPSTVDRPKTPGIMVGTDRACSYVGDKAQSKTCDNGRGMCKAGLAEHAPRVSLPSTVGRSKLPGSMVGMDQKGSYVGIEAHAVHGSGMCKAGFAPRAVLPSVADRPKMPGVSVGMDQEDNYVDGETQGKRTEGEFFGMARQEASPPNYETRLNSHRLNGCRHGGSCWRPLCPYVHASSRTRARKWAEFWAWIAAKEDEADLLDSTFAV